MQSSETNSNRPRMHPDDLSLSESINNASFLLQGQSQRG
ncbi:hypothetical protein SynSYN20_00278 [Synechococcus sp. SYN20]|nr:hypothetical protein SynSYN20_00278 [Synechococcus sp. SYN20]